MPRLLGKTIYLEKDMTGDLGNYLDIFKELEENQKEKERKAKELAEKQERKRKEREAKELAEKLERIQRNQGLILVKGGTMILENYKHHDNPKHTVTLNSFLIGQYPVTQKLWNSVMAKNPSFFKGDNRPVENVCWYEAIEFCNEPSKMDGITPCYKIDKANKDPNNNSRFDDMKWTVVCDFNANGYRLPTSDEKVQAQLKRKLQAYCKLLKI